jgi:hypothetical protein
LATGSSIATSDLLSTRTGLFEICAAPSFLLNQRLGATMRSRLMAVSLAVFLSVFHFACTKKPTPPSNDSSTTNAPANTTSTNSGQSNPQNQPEEKPAPAPQPIVIPSGTKLTVQLGNAVGSKISQPGQSFSASLSNPVQVNGTNVIPAGATASGTVVDAKPLGRFAGGASLSLKLTSITVNGQAMTIVPRL